MPEDNSPPPRPRPVLPPPPIETQRDQARQLRDLTFEDQRTGNSLDFHLMSMGRGDARGDALVIRSKLTRLELSPGDALYLMLWLRSHLDPDWPEAEPLPGGRQPQRLVEPENAAQRAMRDNGAP